MGRWFLLLCVGFLFCCTPGALAEEVRPELDRNQPIEITSQRLEVLQQQRQSIFSGDVVAQQGDMTLRAETLIAFFQKDQNQIERLEATGNVRVIQLDRMATAEKATFYQLEEVLTLSGQAEVKQGENSIFGDEITLFLKENRSLVESSTHGRVKAVIVPEKKQEKSE